MNNSSIRAKSISSFSRLVAKPSINGNIGDSRVSNNKIQEKIPETNFQNKLIKNKIRKIPANERFNGILLRNSFYNDENREYINKSQSLLKTSRSYQAKPISTSIRKRIETQKLEQVIKRKNSSFYSSAQTLPIPKKSSSATINNRYHDNFLSHRNHKINKLLPAKSNAITINKKILQNSISKKLQTQSTNQKWLSPFKSKMTINRAAFEGKQITQYKPKFQYTKDEIRVLNIDKLFKGQKGTLKNIPLPNVYFKGVLNRENMNKSLGKPETINYIINDFNNLCKINRLIKTKKFNIVKGQSFTHPPSLQQLLGLKNILQARNKKPSYASQEQITDQVFQEYCIFYKNNIRKEKYLTERFLCGIKAKEKLTINAYIRFYELFISKTPPPLQRKIDFLEYFFIPFKTETIDLQMFKLLIELLSEKLPNIKQISLPNQILTKEEKCKIFYDTLIKVLIGPFQQKLKEVGVFNREMLRWILTRNQDSVNLIMALFHIKSI